MTYETVISIEKLKNLIGSGSDILLLDCEFDLAAPDKGQEIYAQGHLPGARYAHLDHDLASPSDGSNGRHPLPARVAMAAWLRSLGLNTGKQVIAYDSNGGAWAARAWWLLRWLGHNPVAVLDGGKPAWISACLPLETGTPPAAPTGNFTIGESLVPPPITASNVLKNIETGDAQVLDARDPFRFAGNPNPMDPVAGHIPGATNRFYRDNLDEYGHFRPAAELAAAFQPLLDGKSAILQCGSGVTACHNALAMSIAGLPAGRLYPGSWSEWISDPSRPIAKGVS